MYYEVDKLEILSHTGELVSLVMYICPLPSCPLLTPVNCHELSLLVRLSLVTTEFAGVDRLPREIRGLIFRKTSYYVIRLQLHLSFDG